MCAAVCPIGNRQGLKRAECGGIRSKGQLFVGAQKYESGDKTSYDPIGAEKRMTRKEMSGQKKGEAFELLLIDIMSKHRVKNCD